MAGRTLDRRSTEKEQFWRRVVRGHAGSGLSVRQYCTDRGVSQPSFFAWRRELARRDTAVDKHSKSLTKSLKGESQRLAPQRFAQLQIAPAESNSGAWIEIQLPAGTRVRVPRGVCPATLADVLTALERRSC